MNLQEITLYDLGVVTQDVAQYSLHHVTYAPAKFEVAVFNSLGDAFTRKYILTFDSRKKCDLSTCKV